MIPNYSAQDWAKMPFKQKWDIAVELEKDGIVFEDWLAGIKMLWPKEVHLHKAHWRHR